MSDRTVHGIASDDYTEIVRYNRAGKWYLEVPNGRRRQQVSVEYAASEAAKGEWFPNRVGGKRFDSIVRKRIERVTDDD